MTTTIVNPGGSESSAAAERQISREWTFAKLVQLTVVYSTACLHIDADVQVLDALPNTCEEAVLPEPVPYELPLQTWVNVPVALTTIRTQHQAYLTQLKAVTPTAPGDDRL